MVKQNVVTISRKPLSPPVTAGKHYFSKKILACFEKLSFEFKQRQKLGNIQENYIISDRRER
jgi:hypothetical protein